MPLGSHCQLPSWLIYYGSAAEPHIIHNAKTTTLDVVLNSTFVSFLQNTFSDDATIDIDEGGLTIVVS